LIRAQGRLIRAQGRLIRAEGAVDPGASLLWRT